MGHGPTAVLSIFGNSLHPGPAEINGGLLTLRGRLRVSRRRPPRPVETPRVILAATADILLTPTDRLEFNNSTTIEGGAFSLDQGPARHRFRRPHTLVRASSSSPSATSIRSSR